MRPTTIGTRSLSGTLKRLRTTATDALTLRLIDRLSQGIRTHGQGPITEAQFHTLITHARMREGILPGQLQSETSTLLISAHLQANKIELTERDIAIIGKIALVDIDLTQPENEYHLHMIRALFQNVERDGLPHRKEKYIYDIADRLDINLDQAHQVKVDIIQVEDISMNIGTRRDVDRICIVTEQGEVSFTISLDKKPYAHINESHSKQEADVLIPYASSQNLWATQDCFGFTTIRIAGRAHGVIFKEYLPGVMISNHTTIVGSGYERDFARDLPIVAFSHGRMVGNIIDQTGAFPEDMNPENVIIDDTTEVVCRTCDLSGLERDFARGIKLLFTDISMWRSYAFQYLFGLLLETPKTKRTQILEALAEERSSMAQRLEEALSRFEEVEGEEQETGLLLSIIRPNS